MRVEIERALREVPHRVYEHVRDSGSRQSDMTTLCVFFFQAEDGIRDLTVTGVQTCALPISEDLTKGPNDADNTYGWAKLMGEFTLQAYAKEHGLRGASCRYFTVYGPRGVENHAVIAMIARAFLGQNPFEVWGDGTQIRNWTYIDDIVEGTILAGEKINDGTPINLGTMERIRVIDCARMVCEFTGHKAEIKLRPDMPTGPLNRVADNSLAKKLLGWEPKVPFREGLKRTINWYYASKDKEEVKRIFGRMLTER